MLVPKGISRILILVLILAVNALSVKMTLALPGPESVELYNLACDASIAGKTSEALVLFKQAVQSGFDDFRFAQADPDLAAMVATPKFQALLVAHQSNLILLSSERGFELKNDRWTDWAELEPTPGTDDSPATIRLKWQPLGLDFELQLSGDLAESFAGKTDPPASGGPVVFMTIAIPDGTSTFESANTFHFLLGKNKSSGTGSLFLPQLPLWQPVSELEPEFNSRKNGQLVTISGSISWQIILPYHPLVDPVLGLNLAIKNGPSINNSTLLFPDPRIFSPGAEIHRFVPLNFETSTWPTEALVGKLSDSLAENDPLVCDLTVISSQSGTGYLKLDFLDGQGRSVLPDGPLPMPQELVQGVNSLSLAADFRALLMGPYLFKADLEMPSGATLNWSSQVLNIGQDWENQFAGKIKELSSLDRPTAQFYFETISTAISDLSPRRHPGSLTTTVMELNSLLEASSKQGSILPNSGVFLLVRTDESGQQRFISMYLPKDFKKSTAIEPVVLWAGIPGSERRLAGRIGRFCEFPENAGKMSQDDGRPSPVYLIPHVPVTPFDNLTDEVSDLKESLHFIQEYFKKEKVALAGTSTASGAVLEFAIQYPELLSRILIFSGSKLDPWPESEIFQIQEKLAPKPTAFPPLTWIDFPFETESLGQGKLLLSVLEDAGYIVQPVQRVKGGLSLSQVTDRLVLWAE